MKICFRALLVFGVVTSMAAAAEEFKPPAVFPLADIKPGLTGTTYTVMQGSEIVPIHTEIYGLLRNAIGPGHHLIIARLNDEKTKLTFAVHGMSGSPLYVDGKIVGALSRRVATFEKDAFCGFTPIQEMLDVETVGAAQETLPVSTSPTQRLTGFRTWFQPLSGANGMTFEPLLTPLVISGLSPRACSVWSKQFADLNFLPVMGSNDGGIESKPIDAPFVPGAPVAALLASGSFNIGGTGTLTYRDGNRILAFGHPMLGFGKVKLPMARAEIVATVPSYLYPYKIGNIGQIVGTITQDRLTAIGGEVGVMPRTVPMDLAMKMSGGGIRKYHLDLFDNPEITSRVVGSVFASTTLLSLERSEEFSMSVDAEVDVEGLPSVAAHDFFSGNGDEEFFSFADLMGKVDQLYNNPFGEARIRKIRVQAAIEPRRREFTVGDVWINRDKVKPGETVALQVSLRPFQGEPRVVSIDVTIPGEIKNGEVKLLVGDADAMRRAELGQGQSPMGRSPMMISIQPRLAEEKPRSLAQLIALMNESRPHDALYYRLSRVAPGEMVQNQRMTSLPPSELAVRDSSRVKDATTRLSDSPVFERRVSVDGVVSGSTELTVKVE